MGRPSNTSERRRALTRALHDLIAKKGYDGASVAEIAARAGLAPGLVHHHFRSKLEILLALVEEVGEDYAAALEWASGAEDPLVGLERFIDLHVGLGRADRARLGCWIALSAEALRNERVRRRFVRGVEAGREALLGILERGATDGSLACADPEAATAAILAAIEGYFVLAGTARHTIPRGSAAPSLRAMAEALVRPSRPLVAPERA